MSGPAIPAASLGGKVLECQPDLALWSGDRARAARELALTIEAIAIDAVHLDSKPQHLQASLMAEWRRLRSQLGEDMMLFCAMLEATAAHDAGAAVRMLADVLARRAMQGGGQLAAVGEGDGVWPVFQDGLLGPWPEWDGHESRGLLRGVVDLVPLCDPAAYLVLPVWVRRMELVPVHVDLSHPAISAGQSDAADGLLRDVNLEGIPATLLDLPGGAIRGSEPGPTGALGVSLAAMAGRAQSSWIEAIESWGDLGAMAVLAGVGRASLMAALVQACGPAASACDPAIPAVVAQVRGRLQLAQTLLRSALEDMPHAPGWPVRRRTTLLHIGEAVTMLSQHALLIGAGDAPMGETPLSRAALQARSLRSLFGAPSWRRQRDELALAGTG